MKIVIAIDSFKGSLSSLEAGEAVREGVLKADGSAKVVIRPLADGGEGTVDALALGLGGEMIEAEVTGPLGESVKAKYCIVKGSTAVIEMAQAAGLPLVPAELRDPLFTTTYGVGELILDAIRRGCRSFIVGIGGSVTILPGVTIGSNVTIGAGSVVTRDIPDNVVAVGTPCKVIKKII